MELHRSSVTFGHLVSWAVLAGFTVAFVMSSLIIEGVL